MRIISLKNVALTSIFLLSIGFNYQVNAGTILHKFQIQLPNGEIQNMSGGPSIHSVVRDNNDIGRFDYCNYETDDSESGERLKAYKNQGYQCYTPSGCDWSTWHAPYFPSSFDSTRKVYEVSENLKDNHDDSMEAGAMNASFANFDPEGKSFTQRYPWAKQYFNTTDPLGGQYFYWEGRVDQICPPDPEDDGDGGCIQRGPQAFKILSGVQKPSQTPGLDYDLRKSGENAVADVQSQIDPLWAQLYWRKLNGDGSHSEPNPKKESGYDKKNVTYNTKPGEKSILYNAVGGNAIHGNVTWVLKNSIPQPNTVPVCDGFNIYKEDNTLLTGAQGNINLSTNSTTKFKVAAAAADKEESLVGKKIDICWTLAGQPEAFYRRGLESITCEINNNVVQGSRPGVGKAETKAKTFQEYVDQLLVDSKNPMPTKISADVKTLINQQINEKGLVFFASFYDSSNLYCTSNVGWNGGKGAIIEVGSTTNRNSDPNNCAVEPHTGRTCTAAVKLQAEPTPTPICGDGVVDPGEQCDDGNTNNNDSCTNDCKTPTVVQARCGDNLCNRQGETCDGTAACTGAGQNASFVCRAVGTAAECTYCGDGIVNGGEECDDGNTNNGDSCSNSCLKPNVCDAQCTAEIGCGGGLTCTNGVCTGTICEEPPRCGDNKCDSGESCDANIKCLGGGELSSGECRTNSTVECTFCGDGIVQTTAGEQCDDGNTNNGDGCDNNCRVPALPRCGDGVCDSGEKCEGTISCLTNQPMSSGQVCRLDCTYCGDRVVQAGEQCDEGGETATCTSSCIAKTVTPPPTVIPTSTAVPTLVPTDLEADDIWIYTAALGMIGLGLVAYKLNLGYKFAGIVMENGGLSLVLKLRHAKKKMQDKGLLRKSKSDFEKDFMDEEE